MVDAGGPLSAFLGFLHLGFRHIVDISALDHILFLVALAAIYRLRDWRQALAVISAFTLGHSITLALAVTDAISVPTRVIEFLIPLTIVATALENIVVRNRDSVLHRRTRPLFAGVFGLVHGAGFAEYLKSLFMDHIAIPLFGFNVGIELGQITVLAIIAVMLVTVDWAVGRLPEAWRAGTPLRMRVVGISAVIAFVASGWALERWPW